MGFIASSLIIRKISLMLKSISCVNNLNHLLFLSGPNYLLQGNMYKRFPTQFKKKKTRGGNLESRGRMFLYTIFCLLFLHFLNPNLREAFLPAGFQMHIYEGKHAF
uniref:Uncharacterized protein n=1 Tax=Sphaerodactylus townsendi TaxID=933632 RepID=A0ACB8GCV6_9SAUR